MALEANHIGIFLTFVISFSKLFDDIFEAGGNAIGF
jgi:hypothetical protein